MKTNDNYVGFNTEGRIFYVNLNRLQLYDLINLKKYVLASDGKQLRALIIERKKFLTDRLPKDCDYQKTNALRVSKNYGRVKNIYGRY